MKKLTKTKKNRKNRKGGSQIDEQQLTHILDELKQQIWVNTNSLDIKKLNTYINEIHTIKNKLDTMPMPKPENTSVFKSIEEIREEVNNNLYDPNMKTRETRYEDLEDEIQELFYQVNNVIADALVPEHTNELIYYVLDNDDFQNQINNIYKILGINNAQPDR